MLFVYGCVNHRVSTWTPFFAFAGPVIGVLFFVIVHTTFGQMVGKAHNAIKSIVLVVACYVCFYVAEHYLHT